MAKILCSVLLIVFYCLTLLYTGFPHFKEVKIDCTCLHHKCLCMYFKFLIHMNIIFIIIYFYIYSITNSKILPISSILDLACSSLGLALLYSRMRRSSKAPSRKRPPYFNRLISFIVIVLIKLKY